MQVLAHNEHQLAAMRRNAERFGWNINCVLVSKRATILQGFDPKGKLSQLTYKH